MNTNNAGGGEILKYYDQGNNKIPSLMDDNLIKQFELIPVAKMAIIALLFVIAVILIIKIFEIRSPFKGKALSSELDHLAKVKKRDADIQRTNALIKKLTTLVEHSPFALNRSYVEYWAYNLTRADIRIPGGFRVMTPVEFNAIVVTFELAFAALGLVIGILLNFFIGLLIVFLSFLIGTIFPMQVVRTMVKEKDQEIIKHFADFYLMIHYVLLSSASTPIEGIMKSFAKTTSSPEMLKFVDVCCHFIDTYGEYEATRYISKQYREVPEIGKLMRLIRQANEGGDIRSELMGFRNELLNAKKYEIEKRMEKLVNKAKRSFYILMPILVQAILSAMSIYMEDIGGAGSLLP